MLVYKFGGASIKSAEAVRNVSDIIKNHSGKLAVVISAMGKTTDNLERIIESYVNRDAEKLASEMGVLKKYHFDIIEHLFEDKNHPVYADITEQLEELGWILEKEPSLSFDHDYDQIICFGEILSSKIVAHFLKSQHMEAKWIDIRFSIKTNNTYREARINWELTNRLVNEHFTFAKDDILVTQGFMGSTIDNITTTLGREGSDYTGAILSHALGAKKLVIWKDVPGVLNADPKWFDETVLLEELSYRDAIELAYYGASVIHPKTIKPLQNKNIDLHVKSFIHPEAKGTVISNVEYEKLVPSFIFKMDQVLIRISPEDFSFIAEDNLQTIFGILSENRVKINLMQNTALNFTICINNDKRKLPRILEQLSEDFKVIHENNLELITIRYFDESTVERVMKNKELILEHRDKKNIQLLVRDRG
ncbi:MAG: aspartate kinase [Cyclobacteriaceae bacterium]|nr:aspartate kinase [Cyclobacteriaceae bacterium]